MYVYSIFAYVSIVIQVYLLLMFRLIDINIDNEIERIHAMRLVRKMMQVNAEKLPQSLIGVLVSIANNGVEEKDKLHKTALSLLCELGDTQRLGWHKQTPIHTCKANKKL